MSDSENRTPNTPASPEAKAPRSLKKAPSLRQETYKPADPNKPAPKTIILDDSVFVPKASMREIAAKELKNRRDHKVSSSFRDLDSEAIYNKKMNKFKQVFADSDSDLNDDDSYSSAKYNDKYDDNDYDAAFDDDELYDDDDASSNGIFSVFSRLKDRLTSPKADKAESEDTDENDNYDENYDDDAVNAGNSIIDRINSIPILAKYGKKILIGIAALIVILVLIIIFAGGSSFKNVGPITIESTSTSQTLNWSGSKKGMTYEIYRTDISTGETKLVDTLTGGENTVRYDNLNGGTLYKYTIVTVNKDGEKTEGTSAEGYTKPNSVTATSAITTKENSLTVFWTLIGEATGYELKYGQYDNLRDGISISISNDLVTSNGDNTYSCLIDNLEFGNTYYISMRTISGENSSEWCPVFSGTVTEPTTISNIDSTQPMVALTFDGGPDNNGVTDRILDALKANNSHATFFQTGENAVAFPDKMQRIVNEGNEVGNHTYDESHVGGEVTTDDITSANNAILAACGVTPKLFRAPQGEVTDAIKNACSDNGMSIVLWNFDSHDWEYYEPADIVDRIKTYVEDGDIIQFRNIYDETASAIEELVPYLIEQGYQLVTVSELIEAKTGSAPQVGTLYTSGYELQ